MHVVVRSYKQSASVPSKSLTTMEGLTLEEILSPIRLPMVGLPTSGRSSEGKENINESMVGEALEEPESKARIYPHGLLAKHETRRNTIHELTFNNTPAKQSKRFALTSPRFAIPALFPPNTLDNITASPSYRIRSKRIKSGENFDIEKYLSGIGKHPSRSRDVSQDADFSSPLKRQHILGKTSVARFSSPEMDNAVNDTAWDSDHDFQSQDVSRGPIDGSHSNSSVRRQDSSHLTDAKTSFKDLVRVEDMDLTVDLLNAPEMRPIFTSRYIRSLEKKYRNEVHRLEKAVGEKNSRLNELLTRVNQSEQALITLKYEIDVKQRENFGLDLINQNLNVQIQHITADLSRATTKLKHKDSLLYEKNRNLEITLKRLEECAVKANRLNELQNLLTSSNEELDATRTLLSNARSEINHLNLLLESEESANIHSKKQMEIIREELDTLKIQIQSTESANSKLLSRIEELEQDIKQTEVAKQDLDSKFGDLVKEMDKLQEDMVIFENQHKELEGELTQKDAEFKQCRSELSMTKERVQYLEHSLESTNREASESKKNESEKNDLLERIKKLEMQNEEKDRIISGDTKKMTQLVEDLSIQRQLLSDLKASSTGVTVGNEDLVQQITNLKRQVSNAQQKTDERIQEVAEQLFHQYSKKHELKVNQLKEKYEAKLDDKIKVVDLKERQIKSMEIRIKTAEKEKNYLFLLLEKAEKSKSELVNSRGRI